MASVRISEPLRVFLESNGALEAFEANTIKHFKRIPKREFKKLTEGFNFAKAKEGRDYWVTLMCKAPRSIGGVK